MADFLLIFLAIFLLFSIFRRYILFFLLNAISKRVFKNFNQMNQQGRTGSKPEGSMHVDDRGVNQKKNPLHDQGEYIDYEEIKD